MAPLHNAASKLSDRNGSASDHPRTHSGRWPSPFAATSWAHPVMRAEGSQATTSAPVSASATASWPKPAATSSTRRPAPPPANASVSAVIRSNRYWLSRVDPVGMTSFMSRSRSTTRIVGRKVREGSRRPRGPRSVLGDGRVLPRTTRGARRRSSPGVPRGPDRCVRSERPHVGAAGPTTRCGPPARAESRCPGARTRW